MSPIFKSSYSVPFSGLKIQDLIKTSRIFPCVILCCRPFEKFFHLFWHLLLNNGQTSGKFFQIFMAFSENLNFTKITQDFCLLKEVKFQNMSFLGMFGTPRSKTFQLKIITVCSCFLAYNLN
jgi:hypothetical protein